MPASTDPAVLMRDPSVLALLEAGGVWLWDADLRTETTVYQDGFWEQYGHHPKDAEETFDFLRFMHTRDLGEVTRAWRAHLDGDTPIYQAEWRLRAASGEWRWIASRGRVIEHDGAGAPSRMVGVYTDITELKASQRGLSESNAEIDAVFRSSRDGLALVGPDLTLLRLNETGIALLKLMTGYAAREGESALDIPAFDEERPVIGDIRLALGGDDRLPPRLIGRPGGNWLEFCYSPVHSAGQVIGVAVTIRDVTARVRMEESRAQAMRLESLGLLAGGIAHDFNNLLAAIRGNIELAQMSELDADTREGLAEAQDAAKRAAEMVAELMAFAGKGKQASRPLSLSALTAEMVRYARKIPGLRAQLFEDLAGGLPEIEADSTQIRQLVLNLVVNAIEATKDHGSRIFVRTFLTNDPAGISRELLIPQRAAPAYVALQVTDDGVGMDHETVGRIFEPFFTTKASGNGLGLASVLGMVRSHGGTIGVDSAPGAGTTFTAFFPAG